MITDITVERVEKLDTTSISDAVDKLGIGCCEYHIKSVSTGPKIYSRAFTIHHMPYDVVQRTVGDFLDDVQPGQVVVIDNGDRDNCTVWGDIMAKTAKLRGIEGTIIGGVCRGIPAVLECGYLMLPEGYYMRAGKDRVRADAVNTPVQPLDVPVYPDDIILGDDTGMVVVPQDMVEEAAWIAEEIEEEEQSTFKLVSQGMALKDARSQADHHHLQTGG